MGFYLIHYFQVICFAVFSQHFGFKCLKKITNLSLFAYQIFTEKYYHLNLILKDELSWIGNENLSFTLWLVLFPS